MKKLGFGLARLPLTDAGNYGSINQELSAKMADYPYIIAIYRRASARLPIALGVSTVKNTVHSISPLRNGYKKWQRCLRLKRELPSEKS
jgi:hypothetical protein